MRKHHILTVVYIHFLRTFLSPVTLFFSVSGSCSITLEVSQLRARNINLGNIFCGRVNFFKI